MRQADTWNGESDEGKRYTSRGERTTMAGHAGFDSAAYPVDACMAWLKANINLEWCGYDLGPTPSYPGAPWMTQ
jgi:hypothetical protein